MIYSLQKNAKVVGFPSPILSAPHWTLRIVFTPYCGQMAQIPLERVTFLDPVCCFTMSVSCSHNDCPARRSRKPASNGPLEMRQHKISISFQK